MMRRVSDLLAHGETVCLCTVVQSDRDALPPGTRVLVRRDGTSEGCPPADEASEILRQTGEDHLRQGKRRLGEILPGLRVFFDILSPETRLLVCGAGHIAVPLARFAREVGFSVTVLDDRPEFASATRFPGCEVVAEDFTAALRRLPLGASTYAVVITRGHEHDQECLAEILSKQTAYVGLIGSRRRVGFVKAALREQGVSEERLGQLFTPIGLPIGAESPAEIALSIISEIVAVRRKGAPSARSVRGETGVPP